jgi:hypothetical protein
MTSGTGGATVFRMIEPGIETLQRWKGLHFSTLHVCVTNRAYLTGGICELLRVTSGARRMRSFARQRRLR